MKPGKLFVVPVINTMGPVTDLRYNDLLNSWNDIDVNVSKIFDFSYRNRFPDNDGNPLKISWFFVNWTGFKTNPVHRDFGWFTIFDHYMKEYRSKMLEYDDGFYWMYNHPPPSGIGNEWGLDWFDNSHYFDILNRYLVERNYFPSVIQIPTEKNNESNWADNWFPFDFSNRNADELDYSAFQEEGKTVADVLDWKGAPTDWSEYTPSYANYKEHGSMKRHVFRVLDIKSRIYTITEKEIEKAFLRCISGKDTVIAAYEHDFRDRSEVIMGNFIEPISRLGQKYSEVNWLYSNALHASQKIIGSVDNTPPIFQMEIFRDNVSQQDFLRVISSKDLFGCMPYLVSKDHNNRYEHHPLDNIGYRVWQIDRNSVPKNCVLGIASSDIAGNVGLKKFKLENNLISEI